MRLSKIPDILPLLKGVRFLLHRVTTRRPPLRSSAAVALSAGVNSGMLFRKELITRRRTVEFVDGGTEMIFGNSLRESLYTSDMMNSAYNSRNERIKSQ